jgi:hypothetical protein
MATSEFDRRIVAGPDRIGAPIVAVEFESLSWLLSANAYSPKSHPANGREVAQKRASRLKPGTAKGKLRNEVSSRQRSHLHPSSAAQRSGSAAAR